MNDWVSVRDYSPTAHGDGDGDGDAGKFQRIDWRQLLTVTHACELALRTLESTIPYLSPLEASREPLLPGLGVSTYVVKGRVAWFLAEGAKST